MDSMKQKYDHCVQHVGQNVHVQMFDEKTFQGFLESVDDEHVYLLVPENVADGEGVAAAYIQHGGQGHHHGGHHHHGGQGHHHGGHHHHGGQGHHHGGHHHHGGQGHHHGGHHHHGGQGHHHGGHHHH
ncbi:hypothetical protein, partial [Geomicrobium sp. JCM 19038]|uniref:hypothetical protein n=1 Tax=Geomicrobium sp. JCM 19038 TaxID=1460635 RepID=UPI0005A7A95D